MAVCEFTNFGLRVFQRRSAGISEVREARMSIAGYVFFMSMTRTLLSALSLTFTLATGCDPGAGGAGDADRDGGHPMFDYSDMEPKSEGTSCEYIYDPCTDPALICWWPEPDTAARCMPDDSPGVDLDWGAQCEFDHECAPGLGCINLPEMGGGPRTCEPMCWVRDDCPEDRSCDQWHEEKLGVCRPF